MTNVLLHIGESLPSAADVNAVHALADAAPCSVLVWRHRKPKHT